MATDDVTRHAGVLNAGRRRERLGFEGAIVWLTGLSGSGKSTVAYEAELRLVEAGRPAAVLDGDNLRHGLNADLGFGEADRLENIRRVREVAVLLAGAGIVTLVPLISPYRAARLEVRRRAAEEGIRFVEVHMATPLEECERRDPKGLYAKARRGELPGFTGIDDPYEAPLEPEVVLTPADGDPATMAAQLLRLLG